jgi:hypothetical protein
VEGGIAHGLGDLSGENTRDRTRMDSFTDIFFI